MKQFLFTIFFLSASNIFGSEVIKTHKEKKFLYVKIVKVEWGDLDSFELKSEKNITHRFVCSTNPFETNRLSRIEYRNIYNIPMLDVRIEDKSCTEIFEYFRATFEVISEENPIFLEINKEQRYLSRIQLPNVNPYDDGYNKEAPREVRPNSYAALGNGN